MNATNFFKLILDLLSLKEEKKMLYGNVIDVRQPLNRYLEQSGGLCFIFYGLKRWIRGKVYDIRKNIKYKI